MRTISTIIALLVLSGTLFAEVWVVRSKQKQRSVWAVTCSNCSESPNSSTIKQHLTVEKPQQPQSATIPQATATYGESCASGQCGQSEASYSRPRLFGRRR